MFLRSPISSHCDRARIQFQDAQAVAFTHALMHRSFLCPLSPGMTHSHEIVTVTVFLCVCNLMFSLVALRPLGWSSTSDGVNVIHRRQSLHEDIHRRVAPHALLPFDSENAREAM